ncbi:MAG: flavodoxin family protein [Thermodesulfobacteria bacterium]|nr:flavodoxin family protein [Thermodesulfobacteriota bacterium]
MKNILLFLGSPRRGGNTDILAEAFTNGAKSVGASVERVRLMDLKFSPCIECGGCDDSGTCILKDDFTPFYKKMEEADVVVLSSPMFFYNITAASQAMVERTQAFWVRQYVLKSGKIGGKTRDGIFLSAGATKGKLLFEGSLRVMRYFFDAIGGSLEAAVLVRGVEKKGDIEKQPDVLESAENLGKCAASGGDYSKVQGIWLPGGKS